MKIGIISEVQLFLKTLVYLKKKIFAKVNICNIITIYMIYCTIFQHHHPSTFMLLIYATDKFF